MTSHLVALCVDAQRPHRLARFWAGLLDREVADDGLTLLPSDDTGFSIRFQPTQEQKAGQNQMHLHLTSTPSTTSSRRWLGRSGSAAGTSTSARAQRMSTWCSPTPRAMSSA